MTTQWISASTAPSQPTSAPKVPYDLEVVPLLRKIQRKGLHVEIDLSQSGVPSLAAEIVEVDGATGRLRLRLHASRTLAEELVLADTFTIRACHEAARIQFPVEHPRLCSDSCTELEVQIGDSFLAYDRRRFYRLCVPLVDHVRCMLSFHAEGKNVHLQLGVLDISEGGVALLCKPGLLDVTLGRRYLECRIELPGKDSFTAELIVANAMEHRDGGEEWVRIGCAFSGLGGVERAMIRQFIEATEYHWRDWLPSLDFAQPLAA